MKVPYLDLKAQYDSMKDEIAAALEQVLEKTAFAGGPFVTQFEEEFAAFCGCEHAVGVGSGTDALWLALTGLGVGPGDEAITVPNTFIATAEAISFSGATPVFIDIDERTFNMDPALLEAAITPKTKAIVPVHLYGQMVDMDPVLEVARKHNLLVVEDAAQAHAATYKGRSAGSLGDAGCFSFYPGKNLGAYGEGGAVVTNNEALRDHMRMMRDHGQSDKHQHAMIGWNARLGGFQGAILSAKLKHLPDWTEARRRHGRRYSELLAGVEGVVTPHEADYGTHVYHVYEIRAKNRDALMAHLQAKDIACGIHYPTPIHLQPAYASLGLGAGSFPVAEKVVGEIVSLPMYPELTPEQVEYVRAEIKAFAAGS